MNSKITYIMVFTMTFLFTTATVYILNEKYVNIFSFDFRSTDDYRINDLSKIDFKTIKMEELQSYTEKILENMRNDLIDTLSSQDSIILAEANKNKSNLDSSLVVNLERSLNSLTQKNKIIEEQENKIKNLSNKIVSNKDSSYAAWKATTVKLYESMPSDQAAKLIQKFTDNEARDIIYTMKKKKAAQILANLNPDFVYRITRSK